VNIKAPFLAEFSTYLFGKAKRSAQETIRRFRQSALCESLSGYARLFENVLAPEFLAALDPTKRNRHFGHLPVFWAWIGQILEHNASCSRGLALIQAWSSGDGVPAPRGDTSSYCQARMRLSIDFLVGVLARVDRFLRRGIRTEDLWNGLVLKAIDGTSVQLMDTFENQEKYPQPSMQKPGCGFPVMGIVGMLNLSHGGWEGFTRGTWKLHDARAAQRLLRYVEKGDLILADRAFCSFELFVRIQNQGGECLMRLHQARHRKLDWRRGKKISPTERLVVWEKPRRQPKTSDLSCEQWVELPAQLTVRYIKKQYKDRSGKKSTLIVATTLLDTQKYGGAQAIDLYDVRWQIELKFRDIKTIMRMEFLAVKSPEMAHKSLLMLMIAYNLLRTLMQRAAGEADKPIHEMSFKGTLDLVVSSHPLFRDVQSKPKRTELRRELIELCATKLIDVRPGRHEPRAVKRRPKPLPRLTAPRHEYQEIPHKENYRKAA
jgi:hypothetical protein